MSRFENNTLVNNLSSNIDELREPIDALNLECLKFKLVSDKKWTLEKADHVEIFYKGFLLLCKLFPGRPIVPTKNIDEFWHTHILDTALYRRDCDQIFGYYLDHFPYFGVLNEESEKDLQRNFGQTQELFQTILNLDPTRNYM